MWFNKLVKDGKICQLKENLGALDIILSVEQMKRLDLAGHCLNDEPV